MAKGLTRSGRHRPIPEPVVQITKAAALFAKALALHQSGQIVRAIALYERVLLLDPNLPEPHNNLGVAFASLGKLEQAATEYRRAIDLDPNHSQAHTNLGYVLRDMGKFAASEEIFRHALAIDPANAAAYSGLGAALMEQDRMTEAEAAFCRAIALQPDFAGAYNNLGLALWQAGRLEEAGRAAEQAIRLAPKSTSYYENLGTVRSFAPGDPYVTALEGLAKDAASLSIKDRMHLHFGLAKAYRDTGRSQGAFRQLLVANALKRQQITYDEPMALGLMVRIREVFTADFIRSREGRGDASAAPVFVVGMPRSGSSLIEQILASHPGIFGAGELGLFEQSHDVINSASATAKRFPDTAAVMTDEHLHALGAHYVGKLKERAPTALRITDKMPGNFIFAGLIHLALPNATIIHAVRDPIDTCVSCFSTHFTRGQLQTYDLAELGRYYRHYRELMMHWHRVLPPGRIIDVHYEELVGDLQGVARRIIAGCGLEWDARCLEFHRNPRTVRTASATQVRQSIYRTSVGAWRRYEAFLGPLFAELKPFAL